MSAHEKAEWVRTLQEFGYVEDGGRSPSQWSHVWMAVNRPTYTHLRNAEGKLIVRYALSKGYDILTIYKDGTWRGVPSLNQLRTGQARTLEEFRLYDLHVRKVTERARQGRVTVAERERKSILKQAFKKGAH